MPWQAELHWLVDIMKNSPGEQHMVQPLLENLFMHRLASLTQEFVGLWPKQHKLLVNDIFEF
jgi:hypothetical protein